MSAQPNSATVAKAIQDCAVAALQAGAEFDGVPIIGRRKGNIVNDIESALAELGACIYVLPGLPVHFIDATPPYADRYRLTVRCIEMPAINETLPDVFELVELVARRLFGQQWAGIEGMNPLVFTAGKPVDEIEQGERNVTDVIFETSLGFLPRVESA